MNILLIAATPAELEDFLPLSPPAYLQTANCLLHGHQWTMACTGVGVAATTYALTCLLQKNSYDFVLQLGICGSFDKSIAIGEVVHITHEQFGDLGAEDNYQFLDLFELGLASGEDFPFTRGKLVTPHSPLHDKLLLPSVSGITVHAGSGNEYTIELRAEKYKCQVESMEGAAMHFVALQEKIPFAQVRAISNYIEKRNRDNWDIPAAMKALRNWFLGFQERIKI